MPTFDAVDRQRPDILILGVAVRDSDGAVEYIRFIRSDGVLRILDFAFDLPESVVYEYVTATLRVETARLEVRHGDRHVTTLDMPLKW